MEALYILTDGKPDTSCNLILKEIERLRKQQDIKIHTISFSCVDRYVIPSKNKKKTILKVIIYCQKAEFSVHATCSVQ